MSVSNDSVILSGLRSVMVGYLSPASVDATLTRSLAQLELDAATLGPEQVPALVEHAMLGLRIFCSPEQLPELMLDLADYCERVEA